VIAISDLEFQFPHSDFRLAVPSLKIARAERVAIIGMKKTTCIFWPLSNWPPSWIGSKTNFEKTPCKFDGIRDDTT
jgi:hypothetical protein